MLLSEHMLSTQRNVVAALRKMPGEA